MGSSTAARQNRGFSTLRQFMRERAPVERCELCGAGVPADHQHLIEPLSRKMVCACQPCAVLFSSRDGKKYKRVPRRISYLADFHLTDVQWENLMLPIGMAFFFYSTPAGKVIALYPGPAGPTESLLDLESWSEIVEDNGILTEMEPDVEALLVNRVKDSRDYYLVPIDECYKLVGLIRKHWRGLSGGTEVWQEIDVFFTRLKAAGILAREVAIG